MHSDSFYCRKFGCLYFPPSVCYNVISVVGLTSRLKTMSSCGNVTITREEPRKFELCLVINGIGAGN